MKNLSVVLTEQAEEDLGRIVQYLEEEWSELIGKNFVRMLKRQLEMIGRYPFMYQQSNVRSDVRRCVLSRRVSIYYKVEKGRVVIFAIKDNRQNFEDMGH